MNFVRMMAQLAALACIAGLMACAPKPPGCSDPGTQALVQRLFLMELEKVAGQLQKDEKWAAEVIAAAPLSQTNVRAIKSDSDIAKLSCAATLRIKVPQATAKFVQMPTAAMMPGLGQFLSGIQADDEAIMANVEFDSQLTDDKNHIVSMGGHKDLAGTLTVLAQYKGIRLPSDNSVRQGAADQSSASQTEVVSSGEAARAESMEQCLDRELRAWDKQRLQTRDEFCGDPAKQGPECRTSDRFEKAARQDAVEAFTERCRRQR